ncbi:MAG: dephospho-CoA kinase [Roseiflexaceae bacterium]
MSNNFKFVIGLTGNIACGKSTVLAQLQAHGAFVIDADAVTRLLQQPGHPVLATIVDAFGEQILHPDGQLNRKALADIVFSDTQQLRRLEAIVHPAVRQHVHDWLAQIPNGNVHTPHIVVIDAIKLIENGWPAVCDEVWVVTCSRETQIARLMQTRNMSRADALMRIDAQSPQATKIAAADVVIHNDGTLADTQQYVAAQWHRIQHLMQSRAL